MNPPGLPTRPTALTHDPILDAIDRAPRVPRLTAEQRAELEQDVADIAAGRVKLVPNDDVAR
ncbi:MAG: addiction module protein [Polyangiaceae bacterium]|nr:addiction module protein [Polyangiaceae bacterium]